MREAATTGVLASPAIVDLVPIYVRGKTMVPVYYDGALERRAIKVVHPPIRGHPRNAVLYSKVIGQMDRTALGQKGQSWD